jgi:hypothetical protein
MLNRLSIVLLSLSIVLVGIAFARADAPGSQSSIRSGVIQQSDVDVLKAQVAQLQKQQIALEKRIAALEPVVNSYNSSPCKPSTGIPITSMNGNYSYPVNRLVLCAIMLP